MILDDFVVGSVITQNQTNTLVVDTSMQFLGYVDKIYVKTLGYGAK